MLKKIPIIHEEWIDYKGKVLIIRHGEGNSGRYQFNGTMCFQGFAYGKIADEFKSRCKWFNPNWWNKKTCWGAEYPKKIYFAKTRCTPVDKYDMVAKLSRKEYEKMWDDTNKIADEMARPSENIIKSILKEVLKNTGKKYEFDSESYDYGIDWFEAHIPLKYEGESFLLTWENCD